METTQQHGNDSTRKLDQKYEETNLKFEETYQQIKIFKVFEKSGNGTKIYEETDLKFEETDQLIKIFKVFE